VSVEEGGVAAFGVPVACDPSAVCPVLVVGVREVLEVPDVEEAGVFDKPFFVCDYGSPPAGSVVGEVYF